MDVVYMTSDNELDSIESQTSGLHPDQYIARIEYLEASYREYFDLHYDVLLRYLNNEITIDEICNTFGDNCTDEEMLQSTANEYVLLRSLFEKRILEWRIEQLSVKLEPIQMLDIKYYLDPYLCKSDTNGVGGSIE